MKSVSNWVQNIGIEIPGIGYRFYSCCDLLKENRFGVCNFDTCISLPRCHRAAVVARIHTKHPGSITVQPAVAQACGGGDGGACHLCVDDTGVVADVRQVDICHCIQKEDAVGANGERQKAADTDLVGGASALSLTLEAPVEFDGIFEGNPHHAEVCSSALSDLGFFCACRADGKGYGCQCQGSIPYQ